MSARGATNAEEVVELGLLSHLVGWLCLSKTGETVGRGSGEVVFDVTMRQLGVRRCAFETSTRVLDGDRGD